MGIFAWLSVAVFILIAIIHVASALLYGRVGTLLQYANIPLHAIAIVLLLFAGARLEVLLLSFTSSFLIYLLCHIVLGTGNGGGA